MRVTYDTGVGTGVGVGEGVELIMIGVVVRVGVGAAFSVTVSSGVPWWTVAVVAVPEITGASVYIEGISMMMSRTTTPASIGTVFSSMICHHRVSPSSLSRHGA